jgi:carbonic anhydrase
MTDLDKLFANNQAWSKQMLAKDPEFFSTLAAQQAPEFLWIGCSDSRVPANQITGMAPGEVFVHRNVGNVVAADDLNCGSVIQYAVEVLQVRHIIVCGHYGCGGVEAALKGDNLGLIDGWLKHIVRIKEQNQMALDALRSDTERHDRLCELNVTNQVMHVCGNQHIQKAWADGAVLDVHGLIYRVDDGKLHDLEVSAASLSDAQAITG